MLPEAGSPTWRRRVRSRRPPARCGCRARRSRPSLLHTTTAAAPQLGGERPGRSRAGAPEACEAGGRGGGSGTWRSLSGRSGGKAFCEGRGGAEEELPRRAELGRIRGSGRLPERCRRQPCGVTASHICNIRSDLHSKPPGTKVKLLLPFVFSTLGARQ